MRLLHQVVGLARALFRHEELDSGIADELRFHIERETAANLDRGMSPQDAYRAARLKVGSVDGALEIARDERPGAFLRQIVRDIRLGGRLLARSPVFAAAAITVTALGIGAVTAIFSVVYGVMLRPLPFHEPDRLVNVWTTVSSLTPAPLFPTAADVREWQRANHVFEDIALVRTTANLNLVGAGEPERLQGARFSPNLLPLLGVAPALGALRLELARQILVEQADDFEKGPTFRRLARPMRGFYGTDLEIVLRVLRVEDLAICGVLTNLCCESTARDAFFRDFRVFFHADATGTDSEEMHLASLLNLGYGFAYVTTAKRTIRQMGN